MLRNRLVSVALLALISSSAFGQSTNNTLRDVPKNSNARPAVESVTAKKIMTADSDGDFHGKKPVTRYELAVTLDKFIQYIEAGKKPLNVMKRKIIPSIPKRASADVKKALTHLVSEGFINTNSPLLSEDGAHSVSANELADILSQVTVRLSDRALPPNTAD